jgi:hypothetical protein
LFSCLMFDFLGMKIEQIFNANVCMSLWEGPIQNGPGFIPGPFCLLWEEQQAESLRMGNPLAGVPLPLHHAHAAAHATHGASVGFFFLRYFYD